MLQLNTLRQAGVGNIKLSDTSAMNKILNNSEIAIKLRPANLKFTKFMWDTTRCPDPDNLVLYAIREISIKKAPVDGAVETARINYDNLGRIVVDMQMDTEGF